MKKLLCRLLVIVFILGANINIIYGSDDPVAKVILAIQDYITGKTDYQTFSDKYVITDKALVQLTEKYLNGKENRRKTIGQLNSGEFRQKFTILGKSEFALLKEIKNIEKIEISVTGKKALSGYRLVFSGIDVNDNLSVVDLMISGTEKTGYKIFTSSQSVIKN